MTAVSYSARAAALVAAGLMAASGVATAATAPASHSADKTAQAAPAKPYGKVVNVSTYLNIRMYPSKDSSVMRLYKPGQLFGIDCKVHAQNINGNSYWYKLRGLERWASAYYVQNYGSVPLCKDKFPNPMNEKSEALGAQG